MNRRLADTALGQQERLTFLKQWTQRSRQLPVTYTYADNGCIHLLEGVTTDFSKSECGIRGSMVPPVGSHTALTLSLRGHNRPLLLDGTVAWTAGEYFGIHIRQLSDKDYQRIRRRLWELQHAHDCLVNSEMKEESIDE